MTDKKESAASWDQYGVFIGLGTKRQSVIPDRSKTTYVSDVYQMSETRATRSIEFDFSATYSGAHFCISFSLDFWTPCWCKQWMFCFSCYTVIINMKKDHNELRCYMHNILAIIVLDALESKLIKKKESSFQNNYLGSCFTPYIVFKYLQTLYDWLYSFILSEASEKMFASRSQCRKSFNGLNCSGFVLI